MIDSVSARRGGVSHQIFKKSGDGRVEGLRGFAGKVWSLYGRGYSFYIKYKLKAEVFNDQKCL